MVGVFSAGAISPQFQKRNELFNSYPNSNIFLQNGQLFARKKICKKACQKIQLNKYQNLFKESFTISFYIESKEKLCLILR